MTNLMGLPHSCVPVVSKIMQTKKYYPSQSHDTYLNYAIKLYAMCSLLLGHA